MASYRIAAPDEYLAITGMGIKTVKITKAAWVWPLQRCMRFSVQPADFSMHLQAMTKEKLQFLLPLVMTIGPDVNQRGANSKHQPPSDGHAAGSVAGAEDRAALRESHDHEVAGHENRREDRGDALVKYAMLLADSGNRRTGNAGQGTAHAFLENIVKGIVEGETRVLVSSMTMEEIFTEREVFKRRIFRNIQGELDQFGLKIYNANVKELKDAPNSTYFESLSRKAHEGATNQARIDVAEAQLRGNVGEQKRKGEQEREIAKINAETAVQKTERDIERANAEATLATRKTALNRDVEIARIEAARATENRDEELKRDVELKRAAAEMERLRASDVVKATIARESKQQAADAKAYEVQVAAQAEFERSNRLTDAAAYKTKVDAETQANADFARTTRTTDAQAYKTKLAAEAEANADYTRAAKATDGLAYRTRVEAEARAAAAIKIADADLVKKQREAEGLAAMAAAYDKMSQALGGPTGLLTYMMIEKGTFVELAKANASAVQGMQPKISVWNTGAQAGLEGSGAGGQGQGVGSLDTMRNVYQMLPPLMSTIHEQTGITLPEWQFGRLAGEVSRTGPADNRSVPRVNGK